MIDYPKLDGVEDKNDIKKLLCLLRLKTIILELKQCDTSVLLEMIRSTTPKKCF